MTRIEPVFRVRNGAQTKLMSFATLKMLGYSTAGMPRMGDWSGEMQLGIRIGRGRTPSEEFFHPGRPAVIYDSARRTVPSYGEFTSSVYELDEPEYGCHLAVRYRARGAVDDSTRAPHLHDVLPGFDTKQKSYRRLERSEYHALVHEIESAPGFSRIR